MMAFETGQRVRVRASYHAPGHREPDYMGVVVEPLPQTLADSRWVGVRRSCGRVTWEPRGLVELVK